MDGVGRPRARRHRLGGSARMCATAVVVVLTGVSVSGVSGFSGVSQAAPAGCWENAFGDLDGGGPDVVIGLPNYDWPQRPDAGAVVVFSNVGAAGASDPSAPARSEIMNAGEFGLPVQSNAHFGASVTVLNDEFGDPDHCSDLLVSAPGQMVNGKAGAGELYLMRGSDVGLNGVDQTFNEAVLNVGGITGGAQSGANFGAEVAASTLSLIAVGVPGRDIGSVADAGRVVALTYLVSDGPPEIQVHQQGGPNAGAPERGDRFGEVLDLLPSGDGPGIVVGVPHEDVGRAIDAGAVALIPPGGQPMTMVTQNSPGAAGTAEAGDRYGASIDVYAGVLTDHGQARTAGVVATGVPGEDVGRVTDAGAVAFSAFTINLPEEGWDPITGLSHTLTQDSAGVSGTVEAGDGFGSSVLSGEFAQDDGRQRLVVGTPGENLGRIVDGGIVSSTRTGEDGRPDGGPRPGVWSQDSPGVPGGAEKGDRFGSRLSALELSHVEDDDDLTWPIYLVTVPGEDRGSVADAGIAYLGVAPGTGRSIALLPPDPQPGGGIGMVPMRVDADLTA